MEVDSKTEALRVAGGAGLITLYGLTLNEWVAVGTLIYLGIQILVLSPKAIAVIKSFISYLKK